MRSLCVCCLIVAMSLLAGCQQSATTAEPTGSAVVVVTGETIEINGHREIPRGMFGVHWMDATPEKLADWGIECFRRMHPTPDVPPTVIAQQDDIRGVPIVIDCLGDRYHPCTVVTDPDWKATLTTRGRQYGQLSRNAPGTWIEFWNEPFLNWAYKPGSNYDRKFYDQTRAAEGQPMTLLGRDKPTEHLLWTRAVRSVHAEDGSTDLMAYLAYNYIGRFHPAGHVFEFREGMYRNEEMWWGRDPTQISYFSGTQNRIWYVDMLKAFAPEAKKANPDLPILAGWSYSIAAGGYNSWHNLYRPVIDECWQWIDGLTEHHYHTNPRSIAARYELVTAYGHLKYGKWLRNYNTETQGTADPQLPGYDKPDDKNDPLRTAASSYGYGMSDILCQLRFQPDKAASRTTHGPDKAGWGLGGDEFVFRMLKPLRGQLVRTLGDDPEVWAVSSVHEGQLVTLIYNAHDKPWRVGLDVQAPAGTRLQDGRKGWVEVDAAARQLKLVEVDQPLTSAWGEAPGAWEQLDLVIPAASAVRVIYPLSGRVAAKAAVERKQYFCPQLLQRINPDEIVSLYVPVDMAGKERIDAAWVRLALDGANHPGAQLRINDGAWIDIPPQPGTLEFEIHPEMLSDSVKVTIKCGNEKGNGFDVLATSVVVDRLTK